MVCRNSARRLYERQGVRSARCPASCPADLEGPGSLCRVRLHKTCVERMRAARSLAGAGRDDVDFWDKRRIVGTRLRDGNDKRATGRGMKAVSVNAGADDGAVNGLPVGNSAFDTVGADGSGVTSRST